MKILKYLIALWPIWLLYGGIYGLGYIVEGETRLLIAFIEVLYFLVFILWIIKDNINESNKKKDLIYRINRQKKKIYICILIFTVILLFGSHLVRISVDYIKKDYLSSRGIYEGFESQFKGGVKSIKISGRDYSVGLGTPGRVIFSNKVGKTCKIIYAKRSKIILNIKFLE